KPDEDRLGDFQERNWGKLEELQKAYQKTYARRVDREGLKFFLERIAAMPVNDRPALYEWIVGEANLETALDGFYENPELVIEDLEKRKELLTASYEQLQASADPFIQLAIK